MPSNFYTGTDASIVTGSQNFNDLISASGGAAAYGITSAQVTGFGALNTTLQSAYTLSKNPSTKTPASVAGKNTAIKNMRRDAQILAKIIIGNPAVSDMQLIALGLLPRTVPTPRPVPDSAPVVEMTSVSGRTATIKVHGAAPDSKRGKPFGAVAANIFTYVGTVAPTDPSAYQFQGPTTRVKTQIQFPNTVAAGATVWVSATWVSARGQMGPASAPINFNLPGGTVGATISEAA